MACSQGDLDTCVRLAEALSSHDSSPETSVKVSNLLSMACTAGKGEACGRAASMLRAGEGRTADVATVRDLATIGCDDLDCKSCVLLAEIMDEAGEEPSSIISVLELACNLYCPAGCHNLALMREDQGRREKACDLFLKGCRMDNQPSCRAVGLYLRDGEAIE